MAPRARFELATRRGELTAAQYDAPYPFPSFSRLEFAFAAHSGRTRRKLLGVDHAPGSYMALRVQGQPAIWVVVLG